MPCFLAQQNPGRCFGRAFNIGGGPRNATSLLELLELIAQIDGRKPAVRFEDWRVGDQRYYVSDIRAFQSATGWKPRIGVREGVSRLHVWLLGERTDTSEALQRGVA